MSRRSFPPVSPDVEELIDAERSVPPTPEAMRKRLELRARTVVWRERVGAESTRGGFLSRAGRRVAVGVGALLLPSLGFGAWLALDDTPSEPAAPIPPVSVSPVAVPSPLPRAVEPGVTDLSAANELEQSAGDAKHKASDRPSSVGPTTKRPGRATAPKPDELELLDSARRAVVRGRFQRALRDIGRHTKLFPKSRLSEERDALRVRALRGAGLRDQADEAASGFESRHPDSVLLPSLKRSGNEQP